MARQSRVLLRQGGAQTYFSRQAMDVLREVGERPSSREARRWIAALENHKVDLHPSATASPSPASSASVPAVEGFAIPKVRSPVELWLRGGARRQVSVFLPPPSESRPLVAQLSALLADSVPFLAAVDET